MKVYKVYNTLKNQEVRVTLFQPPYENENILHKTGWKEKDCEIEEVKAPVFEEDE
tara:strand:- start:805 stop:969 length:165 start_codon:yes stop_codon:yes gene_type:complete